MPTFTLKATSRDASHSIILAFHSKWYEPLRKAAFSVVFRKKGPTKFRPDWLYAYITTPVSAIVGRLSITDYRSVPLEQALAVAPHGMLTSCDLRVYAERHRELFVFHIGGVQLAQHPLTMQRLASEHGFWPSSNYIPLSQTGKTTIDEACDFVDV